MDGRTDGREDGRTGRRTGGLTIGQKTDLDAPELDGQVDEQADSWLDGWMFILAGGWTSSLLSHFSAHWRLLSLHLFRELFSIPAITNKQCVESFNSMIVPSLFLNLCQHFYHSADDKSKP